MDNSAIRSESANAPGHFIPFAFPGLARVGCAFSTALAGTMSLVRDTEKSEARENRRRLLARLGIDRWAELRQVHGDAFILNPEATDPDSMPDTEADGACTREKGLALVIKTADCQPVLLADKSGSAVAALHAGWRGNAARFPVTAVARFCEACDLDPRDLLAVRGPSLGPGAAEFVNFAREWPQEFRPWFDEQRRTMDLWSLLRHQLLQAGLLAEHVFCLDLCTWSLPGTFFSHRRGHSGRQASLIWIKESAD